MADAKPSPPPKPRIVVRFKYLTRTGSTWHEGRITRYLDDGSVEIVDEANGNTRTFTEDKLEMQTRGPRGALKWVPMTDL